MSFVSSKSVMPCSASLLFFIASRRRALSLVCHSCPWYPTTTVHLAFQTRSHSSESIIRGYPHWSVACIGTFKSIFELSFGAGSFAPPLTWLRVKSMKHFHSMGDLAPSTIKPHASFAFAQERRLRFISRNLPSFVELIIAFRCEIWFREMAYCEQSSFPRAISCVLSSSEDICTNVSSGLETAISPSMRRHEAAILLSVVCAAIAELRVAAAPFSVVI